MDRFTFTYHCRGCNHYTGTCLKTSVSEAIRKTPLAEAQIKLGKQTIAVLRREAARCFAYQ